MVGMAILAKKIHLDSDDALKEIKNQLSEIKIATTKLTNSSKITNTTSGANSMPGSSKNLVKNEPLIQQSSSSVIADETNEENTTHLSKSSSKPAIVSSKPNLICLLRKRSSNNLNNSNAQTVASSSSSKLTPPNLNTLNWDLNGKKRSPQQQSPQNTSLDELIQYPISAEASPIINHEIYSQSKLNKDSNRSELSNEIEMNNRYKSSLGEQKSTAVARNQPFLSVLAPTSSSTSSTSSQSIDQSLSNANNNAQNKDDHSNGVHGTFRI